MNSKKAKSYIHYDPERVDFSLTGQELDQIINPSYNYYKDFCILSFALGIPCLINAIVEISKQQKFESTLSFNINLVVGIVGIFLGIFFAFSWSRSHRSTSKIIEKIKNKPKIPFEPSFSNIGEIKANVKDNVKVSDSVKVERVDHQ